MNNEFLSLNLINQAKTFIKLVIFIVWIILANFGSSKNDISDY